MEKPFSFPAACDIIMYYCILEVPHMEKTRREIMDRVYLTYLPAKKFKTSCLSAQFITPLRRETASYGALLPLVLQRGTMSCPDIQQLSAAMDQLYGAQINPTIRKRAECQCIGFVASVMDDSFAPQGERLLEPTAALLGELLLDPVTRNGRYLAEYVDSERANLLDSIRSIRNDKRDWADLRLLQEMCRYEPYGVSRLGDEATAAAINNQKLHAYSQQMMAASRLELFYCGSAERERVEEAISLAEAFAALPRGAGLDPEPPRAVAAPAEPRIIHEAMDVTQGKLSMGFRCATDDVPAMILANLLFGGTSNSKLFMNVREKLLRLQHLCPLQGHPHGVLRHRDRRLSAGPGRDPSPIAGDPGRPLGALGAGGGPQHHAQRPDLPVGFPGSPGKLLPGAGRHWPERGPGDHAAPAGPGDAGAHPGRRPERDPGHRILPARKGGGLMKTLTYPRIGEKAIWEALPNGLPVCVVPKPGYARKFAFFTTRYGGMDMRFRLDGQWLDTPAGIAHYLEHKMFDTADGSAMQDLARGGAEPNAYTSNAVTAYYFDCTEHFYDNLRILLSFVSVPYFTDESVEKEQGIIAQEIGMIEDNPEWQVYRQMMQALYRHSPVRQSVAGSVESIRQITAQTLYDCHKAFYTPANMCLVVVGDVDPAEVLRAAREILPRESGPVIPRDYGREEDLTPHMTRIEDRMEVAMPTFLLGFKCPPVPEGPDRMRLDILGDLACDVLMGESSPLFTRLYSQGLINGTFDSAYDLLPGAAYVFCGGDSNDPEAVQQAVLDEARRVVREGVDPAYVQRLRRASFGASIKSLNSFEAIASTVSEGCFQGYDPFRFPEVYDSITQQDLLDFIRDNIRPERMALSIIYPKE